MNNALNTFAKSAENLSKNPLGIIGLFIVLVYGIAGMVLITTSELGESKQYLVWFLIGFPILILWTFYNLVTKHYSKLYAPSDYQDEKNFMKAIDIDIVTGSIETTEQKITSRDINEVQESLNTLVLIEELQNQMKELTKDFSVAPYNSNEDVDYVEEKFKEDRELLEKTRSLVNWKGATVHVNTLLEDAPKLIFELVNNGVGSIEEFGVSSIYEFRSDVKLLTFGEDITITQVKVALELAVQFNITYINVTEGEMNKNGIYFGSYGYSNRQVAKINDLPIIQILSDEYFLINTLTELINAKAVYNLKSKAIGREKR